MLLPRVWSAVLAAAAVAQTPQATPRLEFEVASLKPSTGSPPSVQDLREMGRKPASYTRRSATLNVLFYYAFKLPSWRISGPKWMDLDHFDIFATMPLETTDDQVRQMLQNLLIDRFKIQFHREQREARAYVLLAGKKGTNLQPVDCLPVPTVQLGPKGIVAKSKTMSDLAGILMRWEDQPVLDQTGLADCYDFRLDFGEEGANGVSVAVSVEQIGLKLESRKTSIEYLVIDHAEKAPIEN
jgi:uncharacterized protein (TIGR03435 family)